MNILAGRITLDFYGNESLTKKKKLISQLADATRRKWSIHLMEVDAFDHPETCVVGFATVVSSRERGQAQAVEIMDYVEIHSVARVVKDEMEVAAFDSLV
jgi:uncharacterized protein YlxP (DUF503 family)